MNVFKPISISLDKTNTTLYMIVTLENTIQNAITKEEICNISGYYDSQLNSIINKVTINNFKNLVVIPKYAATKVFYKQIPNPKYIYTDYYWSCLNLNTTNFKTILEQILL